MFWFHTVAYHIVGNWVKIISLSNALGLKLTSVKILVHLQNPLKYFILLGTIL